jgi:hypothetical protein
MTRCGASAGRMQDAANRTNRPLNLFETVIFVTGAPYGFDQAKLKNSGLPVDRINEVTARSRRISI